MKAIMISIQPQWVGLILNYIKKDEIRKGTAIGKAINKLIEKQGVAPMFIYCTKGKETLWRYNDLYTFGILSRDVEKQFCAYGINSKALGRKLLDFLCENGIKMQICTSIISTLLNGKVVARFNATAEHIEYETCSRDISGWWKDDGKMYDHKDACLNYKEMFDYVGAGEGTAVHINDLEIFDEPKELSEFRKPSTFSLEQLREFGLPYTEQMYKDMATKGKWFITRAPQSWCYVEI